MKAIFTLLICLSTTFAFAQTPQFRSNLYIVDPNGNTVLMDGTLSLYDSTFHNAVDNQDARKMFNPSENWGMVRDGYILIVERKQLITGPDTIYFKMWNMRVITYRLEFAAKYMDSNVVASLRDKYLDTVYQIDLKKTSYVDFKVTSDVNSKRADRFELYFNVRPKPKPKPMEFVDAQVQLAGKNINILWQTIHEHGIKDYTIENSSNGVRFTESNYTEAAHNEEEASYSTTCMTPGNTVNYFRVRANHIDGNVSYSKIIRVDAPLVSTEEISLYPNPATSANVQLRISKLQAGSYTITVVNNFGRVVHQQTENVTNGNAAIKLNSRASLPAGLYRVEIKGSAGYHSVQNLLIRN